MQNPAPIDKLVVQIARDVASAIPRFQLFKRRVPRASTPLSRTDDDDEDRIDSDEDDDDEGYPELACRRAMFKRVNELVQQQDEQQRSPPSQTTPQLSLSLPDDADETTLLASKRIPAPSGVGIEADTHAETVARLLFVFSQANPQWTYNQSLVDVLGVLYTTFARHHGAWAEERTYWTFCALVRELSPVWSDLPSLLACFRRRARWLDPPLYDTLEENGLKAETFASRWISMLLVRDVPRVFVPPIWDALFGSGQPVDALLDLCAATLVVSRPVLLGAVARRRRQKGLFTDSDEMALDAGEQLRLLRAVPLDRCAQRDTVPQVAARLRQARQEESVVGLGLGYSEAEGGMYDVAARLSTSSAQWAATTVTSVTKAWQGLPPATSVWSSITSWSTPTGAQDKADTPEQRDSPAKDTAHVSSSLQDKLAGVVSKLAPETPPPKRSSLQGPRPLILSSRHVSGGHEKRRDSSSSTYSISSPPVGALTPPPALPDGGSTGLYRIGSRQGSSVARKRMSELTQPEEQTTLGGAAA